MQFNYLEPISSYLPDKIKIDHINPDNNIYEAILIRLFSGTVDFNNLDLNPKKIKQRINYFIFTYQKNTRASAKVLQNINSVFITDDINNYLLYSKNKEFFKELVHELASSLYFKEMQSYTTAFIHIYRFLEHISITFPLFYSSISNDYNHSFGALKTLFNDTGNNANGLKFNKIFFKKLFDINDSTIAFNNMISIDFSYLSTNEFNNIRKAFLLVIRSDKSILHSDFDFSNSRVTFKFSYMHDLIIVFRNRFFHYMPTQDNISATYFVSELFFKEFNEYALNWLAYLFYEITEKRIEKLI